jgi:hypothetical protein
MMSKNQTYLDIQNKNKRYQNIFIFIDNNLSFSVRQIWHLTLLLSTEFWNEQSCVLQISHFHFCDKWRTNSLFEGGGWNCQKIDSLYSVQTTDTI